MTESRQKTDESDGETDDRRTGYLRRRMSTMLSRMRPSKPPRATKRDPGTSSGKIWFGILESNSMTFGDGIWLIWLMMFRY